MTVENNGALKGIRVIELGQLIAGPFCGQLLGDMVVVVRFLGQEPLPAHVINVVIDGGASQADICPPLENVPNHVRHVPPLAKQLGHASAICPGIAGIATRAGLSSAGMVSSAA